MEEGGRRGTEEGEGEKKDEEKSCPGAREVAQAPLTFHWWKSLWARVGCVEVLVRGRWPLFVQDAEKANCSSAPGGISVPGLGTRGLEVGWWEDLLLIGKLAPRSCPFNEEGHHREKQQVELREAEASPLPFLQCECRLEAGRQEHEWEMEGQGEMGWGSMIPSNHFSEVGGANMKTGLNVLLLQFPILKTWTALQWLPHCVSHWTGTKSSLLSAQSSSTLHPAVSWLHCL